MRTVEQAIEQASSVPEEPKTFSCWQTVVSRKSGIVERGVWRHNLTTTTASGYTNALDWLSKAMGQGPSFAFATAQGNATATTATTLTAATGFPTSGQALAGSIVVAGPNASGSGSKVYGVIVSNSATVLTVDQWYDPTSASGAAGTTPNATCSYVVLPGQNPAAWMAITANSFSPTTADTTLAGELTTNGFTRAVGTYAHTAAATTYSLVHLWTSTGGTTTINVEAQFGACNTTAGGVMPFESSEPTPPTLLSGDTLQNTVSITV